MKIFEDGIVLEHGEKFDASIMKVNTSDDVLCEHIHDNIRKQLPQLSVFDWKGSIFAENPQQICLVGGGWSLNEPDVYEELRQLYFDGAKIIALNGSARWLMERNLRPSMHIILDARQDNIGFITEPIPNCKYYLASQVHPDLFDALEDRDLTIFHAMTVEAKREQVILDDYYGNGHWFRVPACGSVGVTSILLLRCLGFKFQHLFGYDSCYKSDKVHHAFPQPLNDNESKAYFRVGTEGRIFICSPWQAAQARSFLDMIQHNGQLLELSIHGDGLLAYLIRMAAKMPNEPITPEM